MCEPTVKVLPTGHLLGTPLSPAQIQSGGWCPHLSQVCVFTCCAYRLPWV